MREIRNTQGNLFGNPDAIWQRAEDIIVGFKEM
jgi:hypothetical protein